MLIVLTSPHAFNAGSVPDATLVKVLIDAEAGNHPVGMVSNHKKPVWFDSSFAGTGVQFLRVPGRQSGAIIADNAKAFGLKAFDVLVLAATLDDVQMGKNGGAILVAAGWSNNSKVAALGIRIASPQELGKIIALTSGWTGQWWYSGTMSKYSIRALSDLSHFNKSTAQEVFAKRLTNTVKNGGTRLNALLTVTARSLLTDGQGKLSSQLWAAYPSSSSTNDDTEVLSDFTHRLRTTVSNVQMCKKGEPLFIRHTHSIKRSKSKSVDRTDPTDQLLSLHLNPFYKEKDRLKNKNVVVVDDCTTYGVSFGVAAALLHSAGAKSMKGVALGKFGDQLRHYDIEILSDPFKPITSADYRIVKTGGFQGTENADSQALLQTLIS